jgi:hypothetical protein
MDCAGAFAVRHHWTYLLADEQAVAQIDRALASWSQPMPTWLARLADAGADD